MSNNKNNTFKTKVLKTREDNVPLNKSFKMGKKEKNKKKGKGAEKTVEKTQKKMKLKIKKATGEVRKNSFIFIFSNLS
jgi:hypothetical protein